LDDDIPCHDYYNLHIEPLTLITNWPADLR
jgi:hypothetical protein